MLLDELERWNSKMNLTAIRKRPDMVTGHIVDSLIAQPLLEGERVLDVGTGPGFPGLPLAIAQPTRQFTLLDSNNKKLQFIEHAVAKLGLKNVSTVWSRAEHYAPGQRFDTVIARALATVPTLLKIAGDHVGERGVFVALKGRGFREELDALPEAWDCTLKELDAPGLPPGSRHAVLLRRKH